MIEARDMIKQGDVVRIKAEWCDAPSEATMDYIALNTESKGRVDLSPVVWPCGLVPVHATSIKHIAV